MYYSLIVFWFPMISSSNALSRFYLEDECGGTIAMEHGSHGYIPAGRLAVTRRSKYRSRFSCQVTIVAPEQQRLIIVFRELDIELEPTCDDDFVQFFDGKTKASPIVQGLKPRICGYKPPVGNYVTTGNAVTVHFQSDIFKQENGFEIVFTAFHEDKSCYHDEFRCANRRCIAKSLECDGFNNCGDHSDECPVSSDILLAIILSVFLVTVVAFGVSTIIRRKHRKSKLRKLAKKKLVNATLRFSSKFDTLKKRDDWFETQSYVYAPDRHVKPSDRNVDTNERDEYQPSIFAISNLESSNQKCTQTCLEDTNTCQYTEVFPENLVCCENYIIPEESLSDQTQKRAIEDRSSWIRKTL